MEPCDAHSGIHCVKRIKANVLMAGGLPTRIRPPMVDPLNFAPRVSTPTLMINGRRDLLQPYETQLEMLKLLGPSEEHKRFALFDSGHIPPRNDVIREKLDWLDRYLGPVRE